MDYQIDYRRLSEDFKPDAIKVLLIGEAPPPNGKSYFYTIPEKYPTIKYSIEDDTSLPATIFNHYFGRRPLNEKEYEKFLCLLKEKGVFLIDIIHNLWKYGEKTNHLILKILTYLFLPKI